MMLVSDATRQRLSANHPEAATEIARLEAVLDDTGLSADLLALCSEYFDVALRGDVWARSASLTDLEAGALDVCEQFMISVSDMRDEHIGALNEHLSADDVYNLLSAIYLIEMSKRLDITLERVLQ